MLCNEIDSAADLFGHLSLSVIEIQERLVFGEPDKHVNIARRTIVASDDRTEERDEDGAVACTRAA